MTTEEPPAVFAPDVIGALALTPDTDPAALGISYKDACFRLGTGPRRAAAAHVLVAGAGERVAVADLRPGAVARTHRASPAYVVEEAVLEHGCSWRVRGRDGITRHYAARAAVLVDAEPPGQ